MFRRFTFNQMMLLPPASTICLSASSAAAAAATSCPRNLYIAARLAGAPPGMCAYSSARSDAEPQTCVRSVDRTYPFAGHVAESRSGRSGCGRRVKVATPTLVGEIWLASAPTPTRHLSTDQPAKGVIARCSRPSDHICKYISLIHVLINVDRHLHKLNCHTLLKSSEIFECHYCASLITVFTTPVGYRKVVGSWTRRITVLLQITKLARNYIITRVTMMPFSHSIRGCQ